MTRLRTWMSLPVATGAALLIGAGSAAAVPAAPAAPAAVPAGLTLTPSPILDDYLVGTCDKTATGSLQIRAMQRIDWIWAPLAVDGAKGEPLAAVLVPHTMGEFVSDDPGFRDRHNLTADSYTAPGPAPRAPVVCTLHGVAEDAEYDVTITGTLLTIPKWLDALQPPIKTPAKR